MPNKVYVINKHGRPLMPCSPAKARHLLDAGKAKVKNAGGHPRRGCRQQNNRTFGFCRNGRTTLRRSKTSE